MKLQANALTNMTPDQVRQIIRDELKSLLASDRYTFQKHLQLFDGRNIQLGKATGTKIGTETTQKLGFYNKAPVVQPAAVTGASAQGGSYNQTNVQSIADAVNGVITKLQSLGLLA